ncbi:MAG: NUDIX domain-containing protein [Candidatus Saccharimonas sp.]
MNKKLNLGKEVGFCFLKPDYVDIVDSFEGDLTKAGLDVVCRNTLVMPPRLIDYIYSDSRGEDFYPTMKHELATRAIEAMVVMKTDGVCPESLATQYVLESLKRGLNGYPNLRKKYHRKEHKVSDQTLADWQEKRLDCDELDEVTIRLTQQNVFHASDGPHDGIGTLLRFREGVRDLFEEPSDPRTDNIAGRLDEILMRHKGEQDMSKIKREWRVIHEMPTDSEEVPIRQVYAWVLTSDRQVVIVSKDGEKWQLPGGKPDLGEDARQTAVREVYEETHVDLRPYQDQLTFFGEYTIEDNESEIHPPRYRQVRSWVRLPISADQLKLSTAGEAEGQRPEDAVRFVRAVPTKNILEYIDWLDKTDEYKALKRNKIIDRANLA